MIPLLSVGRFDEVSIQALAARHRITLNRVASPVYVTTGRRLAEGLPSSSTDDIIVMLNADLACKAPRTEDINIYWGAYLGTDDETLISGKLADVIEQTRREHRQRQCWIMDTYLLRRTPPDATPPTAPRHETTRKYDKSARFGPPVPNWI